MAVVATLGLGVPGVWKTYETSLPPLDLKAALKGSTVAVDRNGKLLRAFTTEDGRWRLPVTVDDVDPRFIDMLLSYEDRRFYNHHGVDWRALARAAGQMLHHGRVISGGSTITMQVARLIDPPQDQRSLAAKLRQVVRALELERTLKKREILDLYLALAPYGGNLEGLRAASLSWFGKEPRRLSFAEQALLVGLPQAPEARRPDRDLQAALRARDRILDRSRQAGLLSSEEQAGALREIFKGERKPFPAFASHAAAAGHAAEPQRRILHFTVDQRLQASLEQLVRESVDRLGPKVTGALLAIDNATGEILAHVGSADHLSLERAGAIDMTQALRSPGSTLKPFIYALAFEDGLAHPETLMEDRRARYGIYAPENFDMTFQGQITARKALQNSLNVPAVSLLSDVGPARLLARLRNAGATVVLPAESPPGLAIALGGLGITLRDLARLYAGLARRGDVPDLIDRRDLPPPTPAQQHIAEPVAAWYVADILRGAPPPTNALAGGISFKTGTSYGYRDAFAVGFDRKITIAVWFGRADNGAVPGLVARQVAAPVLFDAFARAGATYEPIPQPPGAIIATTSNLPPPLRHLRKDAPKTVAAATGAPLKIAYPPDGARVDLGLSGGGASASVSSLALKAQGGIAPFTWMVNGAPVGAADIRRQTSWRPDGSGFARVSIIDAKGASDSVLVRLE
ncbi:MULTISPECIES: penicillin-binding protein 1C [unclassified Beijerinckia]|uniref:penicillin-binding protein 1C n=1 Tax=unclassified Beijerinckia TaxID=2638183 RepID=UPI000B85ED83|nr:MULTISPECIES: penicillin-binding protein 1C [unclassified Beijerinckia]